MNLLKKSAKGIIWSFFNSIGMQIVNFGVQILLARILAPEIFGLMAIVQIFLTIGLYLVDGGLGSSLIRMKDPTQDDFSTVFYTNVLFGALIYVIIFFFSPYVSSYYHNSSLNILIRVISISILIRSFAATQLAILTRKMDFRKLTLIQVPSSVVSGIVGISLAMSDFGIWSLVYMNIVQALIFSVSFWLQSNWRPSLIFKKELFRYHFNFGFKISLTNVMNGVFDNIYNMVIGKVYGLTMLSFYNRAELFQFLPGRIVSSTLEKVTFPMFSEIQDDNKKIKTTYVSLLTLTIFFLFPVLILFTVFAEPLFRLLLTEKWLGVVPYFQGLLIAGLFNPLQRFNLNILRVKNKPGAIFWLNLVRRVCFILGIYLTINYDLLLMVYMQSVIMIITFVFISYYVGSEIDFNLKDLLKKLLPLFAFIAVWALICIFISRYFERIGSDFFHILITFVLGMSLYFSLSKMLGFRQLNTLKGIYTKIK